MSSTNLKYQKIIKVGNSLAITLDRDFVNKTDIKAGDEVAVNYQPEQKVVSYAPVAHNGAAKVSDAPNQKYQAKAKKASTITPELEAWVDKMLVDDKEMLEKLANL